MTITNWREFAPGLYSSGQPTAQQWPELRAAGLAAVLNLRPDSEQPGVDEGALVRNAGLHYSQLAIDCALSVDKEAIAAFAALLGAHPAGGLLIHCASGNRVGAMVALHEFLHGPASVEAALELGRHAGLTGLEPRVRELMSHMA